MISISLTFPLIKISFYLNPRILVRFFFLNSSPNSFVVWGRVSEYLCGTYLPGEVKL